MKTKIADKNRWGGVLSTLATYTTVMLCASGCTRSDDVKIPEHISAEMKFTATLSDATTRAIDDVNFATHGIYIGGYHTIGKIADAVTANADNVYPNVFDKDVADGQDAVPLVKEQTIEGVKKYVLKTVKWTLSDDTYLNYFAWSQNKTQDAVSGIVKATKDINDKGYPWLDIVNENDINKQVDIVGARYLDQQNNVVVSAVDLNFRHLMSKISFQLKNSTGVSITLSEVKFTYVKLFSKARYTFSSNTDTDLPGNFTGHNTLHTGTGTLSVGGSLDAGNSLLLPKDMVVIPQTVDKGFLKVEFSYTVKSGTGDVTKTHTVNLPAGELLQGRNHIYTFDMSADQVTVNQAHIADWILEPSTALPIVPGLRSDVLLLLNGYDKPYQHIDGKWYWLDRSGWNRHCELVGYTDGMYSPVDHSYYFAGNDNNYASVPAFSSMTAINVDIVAQQVPPSGSSQMLLQFYQSATPDIRRVFTHMGNLGGTTLYFDCSDNYSTGQGRITYDVSANSDYDTKTLWSFQKKDGGSQSIYRNAGLVATSATSGSASLGVLNLNTIGKRYKGKVSYVKVTNTLAEPKKIVATFVECRTKFQIPINEEYLPTVTDGLVFCYDGRSGIKTVGSDKFWEDQISKNDAKIIGNVTYDPTGKYFYATNSKDNTLNYLKMIYNVTVPNDFTVEIILRSNGLQVGSPFLWAYGTGGPTQERILFMHFPYETSEIYVDSPGVDRYFKKWPTAQGAYTDIYKLVIRRKYKSKSEFFMSNNFVMSDDAKTDISTLGGGECTIMQYYSEWSGRIYSVRLYDRALTDAEMLQNYNFDKKTFPGVK